MSKHRTAAPVVFLDFDGTITRRDVTDVILEAYADESWVEVERRWRAGETGSRECLRAQMALVRATRAQVEALVDTIEIDEGFAALLEACARRRLRVNVVSDGFDHFIRRILERPRLGLARLLRGVRVHASHLEFDSRGAMRLDFPYFRRPCEHGCATCIRTGTPRVGPTLSSQRTRSPNTAASERSSTSSTSGCARSPRGSTRFWICARRSARSSPCPRRPETLRRTAKFNKEDVSKTARIL